MTRSGLSIWRMPWITTCGHCRRAKFSETTRSSASNRHTIISCNSSLHPNLSSSSFRIPCNSHFHLPNSSSHSRRLIISNSRPHSNSSNISHRHSNSTSHCRDVLYRHSTFSDLSLDMCHTLDNGDIMPKCENILFAYITVSTDVRLYKLIFLHCITRWDRVTHICVRKLTTIGSDNGLSPARRQANIWTNAGILLIGPLGTNFSEIFYPNSSIFINENALENVVCEMACILSRPQCDNIRRIWWYLGYYIILCVELVCMFVWLLSQILALTRQ